MATAKNKQKTSRTRATRTRKTSSKKTSPKNKKSTARKPAAKKAPTATPKTPATKSTPKRRDPRLPAPGTVIERVYKGKTLQVEVRDRDFVFAGKEWSSLTAIALAVTGAKSINGRLFFRVSQRAPKAADEGRSS